MARKAIAVRYSERTLRQIEWLAQRDGSTKTEVVTAAIDRMARESGWREAGQDPPGERA